MGDTAPGDGTLRLFLSVPPPARLLARLEAMLAQLEADAWTLRRAAVEDLHVTLHFLGATPTRVVDDLRRELGAVCDARRPFDLYAGGLGCFPDETAPKVLWAGIQDPAKRLEELFLATRRVLNGYRLFSLREAYTPHLTLAKVERLSAAWDPRLLQGLAGQWRDLGVYPVEEVQLMARRPQGAEGPRYECLAAMKLKV